jgi:hypothetical protein
MLCDVCKAVVDNLKEFQAWYNHHRTDKNVRDSAEQGCHWCKLLWKQIQPTSDSLHNRVCDIRATLENLDTSSSFLQFGSALPELDDANFTLRIMLFPADGRSCIGRGTFCEPDTTQNRRAICGIKSILTKQRPLIRAST